MLYLDFKGRKFVENHHYSIPHHTLDLVPDLSFYATDATPKLNGNLIIEGENLIALKSLLPAHAGTVKCVYMDPPYNTGNEEWIYNDNLTAPQFREWIGRTVGNEADDATRHDKWCCMMLPRLKLVHELLSEDGVLFVSIDDNEMHHLRCLLDEVFGASNFVANIVWQKRYSRENREAIGDAHEYILVYEKRFNVWRKSRNLIEITEEQAKIYKNNNNDPQGRWRPIPMTAQGKRVNQMYKIVAPGGATHVPPPGRCWSMIESEFLRLKDEGRIYFGQDNNSQPQVIRYLSEVQGMVPWTWWPHTEVGHTDEAKKEIHSLLGKEDAFPTPKPTRLIKRIVQIATTADDIVLDCTAGSGTTAHAVLQLNAEDGGNRRFILVQHPNDSKRDAKQQVNICQDITRERVSRAIKGVDAEPLQGGFAYARLSEKPLLGEYREMSPLPKFEDLARYIFYTHTSSTWPLDAIDVTTGFIGEHRGTAFYLLYQPHEDVERSLDRKWLTNVAAHDPRFRLVVYTERFAIHADDLREWCTRNSKDLTRMLVPFELK